MEESSANKGPMYRESDTTKKNRIRFLRWFFSILGSVFVALALSALLSPDFEEKLSPLLRGIFVFHFFPEQAILILGALGALLLIAAFICKNQAVDDLSDLLASFLRS